MNKLCIMDSGCCYRLEPRGHFYITVSDPCLPCLLSPTPKLSVFGNCRFWYDHVCARRVISVTSFGPTLITDQTGLADKRVLKFPPPPLFRLRNIDLPLSDQGGRLEENYQPVDYRGGQRLINRSDHRAHGGSERARGLITGSDDHREHRKHCGQRIDDSHASAGKL